MSEFMLLTCLSRFISVFLNNLLDVYIKKMFAHIVFSKDMCRRVDGLVHMGEVRIAHKNKS